MPEPEKKEEVKEEVKPPDIQAELDLMNNSLQGEVPHEEPKPEEKEPPAQESKAEDGKEKIDAAPEPESKSEEKEEPKSPEDVKPPAEDERDKTIAELRAKLAESEAAHKPPEREPEKKEEKPPEPRDFIGDMDLDDLTRDPKKLNEVFNKVYQQAVADTQSRLPDVIKTQVDLLRTMEETGRQFYETNPDLKSFPKVVAVVFDELVSKDPNRAYNEVVKEVGPEVRKRLNLPALESKQEEAKQRELKQEKKQDKPPRLPNRSGGGGSSNRQAHEPEVNPLQNELDEMNKSLGR